MIEATPQLPITRLRLRFDGPAATPDAFTGNHWRGAFGPALRERACLTGAPACDGCTQRFDCSYAGLFETPTPPDAAKMRRYAEVPHPYVLYEEPAADLRDSDQPGAGVTLAVTLFGRAAQDRSLVSVSLAAAARAERGIGGRKLQLRSMETAPADATAPALGGWRPCLANDRADLPAPATWPSGPPAAGVRIRLLSPLRIKREGRPVSPAALVFADLFGVLLRRLSMLTTFHADTPLETDFRALMDAARAVPARTSLRWVEQQRHSSRQHASMPMGGVVGHIDVPPGVDLTPFWPCLWLGQHTHAGAATTMGLGRYELLAPESAAAAPVVAR